MDPIQSNTDRLIWLLRQRLLERTRAAAKPQGASKVRQEPPSRGGMDTIQALAAVEGLDDRALKRALIQNLLADQLGEDLVNEAQFQQIVARVTDTLEADEAGAKLLTRLAGELRASARP